MSARIYRLGDEDPRDIYQVVGNHGRPPIGVRIGRMADEEYATHVVRALNMDEARRLATLDCDHPGEYLRLGTHNDVTGRWVPDDINPAALYCLRCEQAVPDGPLAARAEARSRISDEALTRAARVSRSIVCQQLRLESHRSCLGLSARMNSGLGCLCPCHDGEPAAATTTTTEVSA